MKQSQSIFKKLKECVFFKAGLVSSLTLFSKILGFFREGAVFAFIGANSNSDAYFLALSASIFVFFILSEGVRSTLIPIISKYEIEKTSNNEILSRSILVLSFVSVFLVFTILIYPKIYIYFFTVNIDIVDNCNVLSLLKINVLSGVFLLISSPLIANLEIKEKFYTFSIVSIIQNLIFIVLLLLFKPRELVLLMFLNLFSNFARLIFVIYANLKLGFKFCLPKNHGFYLRNILRNFIFITISASVYNCNTIVDRNIASVIAVGGVSLLYIAEKFNQIFYGLITVPISLIFYPKIAKNMNSIRIKHVVIYLLIFNLAYVVITYFYGVEILKLVFPKKNISNNQVNTLVSLLLIYGLGFTCIAIREICNRVFFVNGSLKMSTSISISSVIVNLFLSIVLSRIYGLFGIAFATVISNGLVSSIMLILVYRYNEVDPLPRNV
jgi:putative peptidoglycan lipid II flippase